MYAKAGHRGDASRGNTYIKGRTNKRERKFRYQEGVLHRVFFDGSNREVPRPAERVAIITKAHDDADH